MGKKEELGLPELDPERVKDLSYSAIELGVDLHRALERAIAFQAAALAIEAEDERVAVLSAEGGELIPIEEHQLYKLMVAPYDSEKEPEQIFSPDTNVTVQDEDLTGDAGKIISFPFRGQ